MQHYFFLMNVKELKEIKTKWTKIGGGRVGLYPRTG